MQDQFILCRKKQMLFFKNKNFCINKTDNGNRQPWALKWTLGYNIYSLLDRTPCPMLI